MIKQQKPPVCACPAGAAVPVALECAQGREYTLTPRVIDADEACRRAETALLGQLKSRMGADGAVEETAFSVEDAGGVFEVTLHAECEEQIGKTVEYME